MATIHILCGSTGAGKTAMARRLAEERGAIRFSIDDWLKTLFHPDLPPSHDISWILDRIERCETEIWKLVLQISARDVDTVLDLGFSKKTHREKFRALALDAGIHVQLHYLTAPSEVRRARVRERNATKSETYSFQVPDPMFDFMEGFFEPPEGEELAGANVVVTG